MKWTIKKAYVDPRSRTRDSNSDSDFKLELKEPSDLPDNIVCYVDDISIPHTWRTGESHNNRFYYIVFKMGYLNGFDMAYNNDPFVLTLPEGNYIGANLAPGIQDLLNGFAATFDFEVPYHPARGAITIETKNEGMDSHSNFHIPGDFGIMSWMGSTNSDYPWKDSEGNAQTVEINNPQSFNGVLRNSDMLAVNLEPE